MNWSAIAAVSIFLVTYILLATEKVHRTKAVLAGAVLMILVGLIEQHTAFHGDEHLRIQGIDWNTIMLLIGMMVIVNITRTTGGIEWLAIRSAKMAGGHPIFIILLLCVVTAALSAFLDNVTTVVIIAPVAILIFERLERDPVPALIALICASNIGGTATLIGDPPNIIIGSAGQFSFMDFIKYDALPALVCLGALLLGFWLLFRRRLDVTDAVRQRILAFDENAAITDAKLLGRCIFVFGLTLVGYVLHGSLGFEPATIALGGAALLLLLHSESPEEALKEVEWSTIFFFIGLFVMIGALQQAGILAIMGQWLTDVTQGNVLAMTMLMLWVSGLSCSVINNIAFTAMMTPLIQSIAVGLHPDAGSLGLAEVYHAPDIMPLWWALSLGACLGGNLTTIGSAANVVVVGIAESSSHPISFIRFFKYGLPVAVGSLVISSIWLWLVFLR